MKHHQRILVFTTTYRPIFRRDLLSVCCRAIGEIVRYGYEKKYLEPKYRDTPDLLNGQSCLIIFAEFDIQSGRYINYHPIRYAQIENVTSEFDSVSFDLKLSTYYPYGENSKKKYIEAIKVITNKPETNKQKENQDVERYFVSESLVEFDYNEEPVEMRDWQNLIGHVCTLPEFKGTTFFRQTPLYNSKRSSGYRRVDLGERSSPAKPVFMRAGRRYEITLKLLNIRKGGPEDDTNIYPELSVGNAAVGGPYIKQQGADAVQIQYLIIPTLTYSTIYSQFSIKIPSTEIGAKGIVSPQYENLAIVTPNVWTWPVIILFVLGLSLSDFAENLIPSLFGSCNIPGWLIPGLQILAPLCMFFASYFGFKKLPLK